MSRYLRHLAMLIKPKPTPMPAWGMKTIYMSPLVWEDIRKWQRREKGRLEVSDESGRVKTADTEREGLADIEKLAEMLEYLREYMPEGGIEVQVSDE